MNNALFFLILPKCNSMGIQQLNIGKVNVKKFV